MSLLKTKYEDHLYVLFRMGIGSMFLMFGLQKLLGLWGMPGGPVPAGSFVWFAAVAEILIGTGLIFGILSRVASLCGMIEMLVAYFVVHVPLGGLVPAQNQGQSAVLFLLAFVVIFAYGSKKFSVEKKLLHRELF